MSEGLLSLFQALREAGLKVTPLQLDQAALVLDRARPSDPQAVEALLRSLLLKSDDAAARALLRQTLASWALQQRTLAESFDLDLPAAVDLARRPPAPSASLAQRLLQRARDRWRPLKRLWTALRRRGLRALQQRARAVFTGTAAVLLLGALAVLLQRCPEATTPTAADLGAATQQARPNGGSPPTDGGPPQDFVTDVPVLTVTQAPLSPRAMAGLGYGGAAALLSMLLFLLRRRGLLVLRRLAAPRPGGPERLLPQAVGGGRLLLSALQEEAMVYGVGRFQSGEPTPHLDLPATVKATAEAAGCFTPRQLLGRYQREVLLWEDRATASRSYGPLLGRLAEEIAAALSRAGLTVERASFLGVPERLRGARGALYPGDLEDRREGAAVLVLTDGYEIDRRLRDERRQAPTRALLRQLAAWPKLAVVDFSGGAYNLEERLLPFGLLVLTPAQAPAFLGCDEAPRRAAADEGPGDEAALRTWAAALALAPHPVSEASALQLWQRLRKELKFTGSLLGLSTLRTIYPGSAGRLFVPAAARAELLRPLLLGLPPEPFPARLTGTLLQVALQHFSREVAAAQQQAQAADARATRGEDSLAVLRLRLAAALLRLFCDPAATVQELRELHGPFDKLLRNSGSEPPFSLSGAKRSRRAQWFDSASLRSPRTEWGAVSRVSASATGGQLRANWEEVIVATQHRPGALPQPGPLQAEVRAALRVLAPLDTGLKAKSARRERSAAQSQGVTLLPWRSDEVSQAVLAQLVLLGLGEAAGLSATRGVRPPRRRAAALLLAVGTAVGALAVAAGHWRSSRVLRAPAQPAPELWSVFLPPPAADQVLVGTARTVQAATLRAGQQLTMVMQRQVLPCRESLGDGELWRCGRIRDPLRPREARWPKQRVAWLAFPPTVEGAQALAESLLDSGSADAVVLGATAKDAGIWLTPFGADASGRRLREILRVADNPQAEVPAKAAELARLAEALRFAGVRDLEQVWPQARRGTGLRLSGTGGGGPCAYRKWKDGDQVFVYVCGGVFTMGSDDDESLNWEKPPHQVRVSDFWMHKYEVSVGQFRPFAQRQKLTEWQQNDKATDKPDLPVVDVNWDEARRYCEDTGGKLPTEAEWEYAARGPTNRRYPWGSDPPPDKRLAAFGRPYERDNRDSVTSHPEGQGPFGTLNQAGNVWEWVRDVWSDNYNDRRQASVIDNPIFDNGPVGVDRVVRGGSFDNVPRFLRSAFRGRFRPEVRFRSLGFRCVRGAGRQP